MNQNFAFGIFVIVRKENEVSSLTGCGNLVAIEVTLLYFTLNIDLTEISSSFYRELFFRVKNPEKHCFMSFRMLILVTV